MLLSIAYGYHSIVQITHVPNMYEYARLDGKVLGGNASIGFINKMAYGSRSAVDFGLIGEYTETAGMFLSHLTPKLNAKRKLFEYIDMYYNLQRRHRYLNYLSPNNFEIRYYADIKKQEVLVSTK